MGGMVFSVKGTSHKRFREEVSTVGSKCLLWQGHRRGLGVDEWQNHLSGVILEGSRGNDVFDHMQVSTGGYSLFGTARGHHLCKIHSRKEEHSRRPAQSSGSGCYTTWSLLPQVFKNICQEFGHPLVDLFATSKAKCLICTFVPDVIAQKENTSQNLLNNLDAYFFPPFTLIQQILSRVILLTNLSTILVAPLWPQRNGSQMFWLLWWKGPLSSVLWNLLVQPKFHRGLG